MKAVFPSAEKYTYSFSQSFEHFPGPKLRMSVVEEVSIKLDSCGDRKKKADVRITSFVIPNEGLEMERDSPVHVGVRDRHVIRLVSELCPSENKAPQGLKMAVTWRAAQR